MELKELLKVQYNFSKNFRKHWFNDKGNKIHYVYKIAYNIMEETIDCWKFCDSKSFWRKKGKLDSSKKLSQEIMNIFNFTLAGIFEIKTDKNKIANPEEDEILESYLAIKDYFQTNSLTEIFKNNYFELLQKTYCILPTETIKSKKENTLFICRKIISLANKIEDWNEWDVLWDIGYKMADTVLENNTKYLLQILKCVFQMWLFWTLENNTEEEFEKSKDLFIKNFLEKNESNLNDLQESNKIASDSSLVF